MEFQFRKAAFGGFHRQDVVDYLDQVAREHSQQVAELRAEIAQLEEENQKIPQLEEEKSTLQQAHDSAIADRDAAQSKLTGLEGQVATLRSANQEAQEKIFTMTPDAEAYRAVKERAAGMELDAHVRAQKTIDEAQKNAKSLRIEVQQWANQVKNQYATSRGELNTSIAQGLETAKTTQKNLEALTQAMAQKDRALEQLIAQWVKNQDKK